MTMGRNFRWMTDRTHKPTEEEIVSFIGERAKEAWSEIRRFLEDYYDIVPETSVYILWSKVRVDNSLLQKWQNIMLDVP